MKPQLTSPGDHLPSITGYQITESLYVGKRTLVYQGVRLADSQPVILKLLSKDCPSIQDLLRFRNYYTITQNLHLPGIIQVLGLEPYGNGFVLVMPDQQDLALSDYMTNHPLSLPEVLAIAIQLAEILHYLYQQRVIHKDIKPANILIHPDTNQVTLIDFSIASLLPKEAEEIKHPNLLEGTLAYLSPEQTGRMNRGIDYRSDFYALGVTLFELLTRQLPFQSTDPLDLIHCHIAVQPPLVHDLNLNIPPILSEIIAKLMAKNAEDRYQSAWGLKYDLQRCQALGQEWSQQVWFMLAERDICDRFLIPEQLYGRAAEVIELLSAFNRVSSGTSELLLVAGFSGIGKTALVNEVHKPIVRQHGYFIKGKFDQFNRNIPFHAFVQALRDLMGQLLSEPDAQLAEWRTKILTAVADNGQVLIDVIPELEYVIGKQPLAPDLTGTAAQNRFNWLFHAFIQVFTTSEHPLVMFLDDLQWADSASLQLIKVLMEDSHYLLLLGAYRDNEVFPAHPFLLTIADLQQTGQVVNTLTLTPLNLQDTNQWIADTLHCSMERARPLTELVDRKTQGNPFFIAQFLKALHQDEQITFNHDQGYWECDIAQVNALSLTDDVVEFMAQQLQKLAAATQHVLKLAACIGNQFDLETLAIVSEQSESAAATALWQALQEGLILPQSEVYKFYLNHQETDTLPRQLETVAYRFLHDRVQQAAYSLIPEAQKAVTHLNIGQLLLHQSSTADREEKIFEIVNQLNYGSSLLTTLTDRIELARLNQLAGSKAKVATAYTAALAYFTTGLQLLNSSSWQQHYELSLKLHESAAEAAYLSGKLVQVEPLIQTVLQHAKTAAEKATVYQVQILTASAQAELFQGVQIGIQALADLGIELPKTVQPHEVEQALQEIATQLAQRSPQELLTLPRMTDATILAAMRILSDINNLAYQSAPQLLPLIMLKQVELSLRYGNSPDSALAYAGYGFIMLNVIGDIETGYAFGQLALNLLDQLADSAMRGKIGFLTTVWFTHWKQHANRGLQPSLNYYQTALLAGDLEFAALSLFLHSYTSYHVGRELPTLQREMVQHHQAILNLKQDGSLRLHQFHEQLVANLQAPSLNLHTLTGKYYDEQQQLAVHLSRNERSLLCHLYINKLMLCYWFGNYELAAENASKAADYLDGLPSTLTIALFSWYDALTLLAYHPQASGSEQTEWMKRVNTQQHKLQVWATHAPMNFLHKWYLVEAERQRVLGDYLAAIEAYDRAITLAKAHDYPHEAALANELAAQFFLGWGKETVAQTYLTHAYYGYAHWGAIAKVNELEQRYAHLLSPILEQTQITVTSRDTVPAESTNHFVTALDLHTILKASQTLSSEIQLDQLLQTLIQIVVTNAGADKAALFLNSSGSLELGIQYFDHAVQSLDRQPVDACQHVPLALIHYVEHTLETVITDYKTHTITFSDPYCLQYRPQSLLCTPILHQGKLMAILYLENAITANAFTDERVELLRVLGVQAAISLENANLYQQSQSYAHQLEASLHQLQAGETRFVHLATNIPGIIYQFRIAADGMASVPYVSSGCYDLYEVTAEEMMAGRYNFRDFEHVEDRAKVDQIMLASRQTLQPFGLEFRIVTLSGTIKWIQAVSQPTRQPDGAIIWDGVIMNISDRKVAEVERDRLMQNLSQLNTSLEQANHQLAEYSQTLEQRVEERTQALSQALTNLQAVQQDLIQSEKMVALGQLAASVAHEINTPLGVVRGATSNIIAAFQTSLDQLPTLLQRLSPEQQSSFLHLVNTACQYQTSISTTAERQLRVQLQTELLAQGIANASHVATQLTLLRLDSDLTHYQSILRDADCIGILQAAYNLVLQYQNAKSIQQEVDRAAKIVFALKSYSHHSHNGERLPVRITDGIEVALTLYHNRLKQGIQVIRHYDPALPELLGNPDELTQVWVNLIDNAIYAIGQQGVLEIAVRQVVNQLVVEVIDSGDGIPAEVYPHIFEPFFTTKPRGEGSGLGLDIVRQIVDKHSGDIQVQSQPGRTHFTVTLPLFLDKVTAVV